MDYHQKCKSSYRFGTDINHTSFAHFQKAPLLASFQWIYLIIILTDVKLEMLFGAYVKL